MALINGGTTPYIGGGITAARAWVDEDNQFNRGMGFYVAGGLQMLRTTQNRLKLELRVDRPLFSLSSQDIMPITIGLFFSRHYVPRAIRMLSVLNPTRLTIHYETIGSQQARSENLAYVMVVVDSKPSKTLRSIWK